MTKKELKIKRKVFLDDTVKYYSEDITRRATSDNGCKYRTKDGRKCAIGRHILDDKYKTEVEGCSLEKIIKKGGYIPVDVECLGYQFLIRVQNLHDNSYNWDDKGLTQEGLNTYESIIKYSYL